ncbi:MAG: iron donor protein CyaY [Lentimonas sp.]|jgi:iron donor protein CyaY
MNETKFLEISEKELISLADEIENNDKNSIFDAEYSDGILNIEIFKTGQIYVINKHSASLKIWFSSPISGADYFSYDENQKKWLNKENLELHPVLINELKNNFNF